jgi:DNA polymerase III subunit delta
MINDINSIVNSGKLPPVLLIFGEEEFLIEEALNSIIKLSVTNEFDKYNFDKLDARESDLKSILDIASSYPMMGDKRTVIVNHFDELFSGRTSKKIVENSPLTRYLNSPVESTFLILIANYDGINGLNEMLNNPSKKSQGEKLRTSAKYPYGLILEKHKWLEFPKIYESSYPRWIESRVKSLGKTISNDALEALITQTSASLRELANETDKLVIYSGPRKEIIIDDVLALTGSTRVYNVFELQKAIGRRDVKLSVNIIEKMLSSDRQEMLIITMLTRYFSILWKLSEEQKKVSNQYELAKSVGVSAYFLPEYKQALTLYGAANVENAFFALCEADTMLKSGTSSRMMIMNKLIYDIIDGKR